MNKGMQWGFLFTFLIMKWGLPWFLHPAIWLRNAAAVLSEGDPSASGAADHLFDPPRESGDASIDAIVVWTAAASAPADHPSEEPAAWRLLANQGPARVPLTGTWKVSHPSWIWKHAAGFVFDVPDKHLSLHCDNQRKAFWEWPGVRRSGCRPPRSPGEHPPSGEHYSPDLRKTEKQVRQKTAQISGSHLPHRIKVKVISEFEE